MDDTLSLINLSASSPSDVRAQISGSFSMYHHAGLEVELESAGVAAHMLSSHISVHNGVSCVFWNKNACFARTGSQRVRRILPCISLSPAAQRAVVTGALHRAAAATIPASIPALLTPLLQLRFEVCSLGYPSRVFDCAFRTFVYARCCEPHFPLWRSLLYSYLARLSAAVF